MNQEREFSRNSVILECDNWPSSDDVRRARRRHVSRHVAFAAVSAVLAGIAIWLVAGLGWSHWILLGAGVLIGDVCDELSTAIDIHTGKAIWIDEESGSAIE